jgi:hypothetical protein
MDMWDLAHWWTEFIKIGKCFALICFCPQFLCVIVRIIDPDVSSSSLSSSSSSSLVSKLTQAETHLTCLQEVPVWNFDRTVTILWGFSCFPAGEFRHSSFKYLTIQIEDFSGVTPCSLVVGYRPCIFHHPEDRGRNDLRNVGILPQHYMASQIRRLLLETPEDGGSMDLRNVGILPQHYTVSQTRRPRLESSPS